MPADSPRIFELRRRVQADPASIAFAQLAEECRRAGANDEAVAICRAGLGFHPDYLSARVTLGRALVELGKFDDAQRELSIVLAAAPENLPAIRAMAEAFQQRGQLKESLDYYKRALQLAKFDPELESAVTRIENVVAPPPKPAAAPAPTKIEDLFDFDTLLQQLGGRPSAASHEPPTVAPTPTPIQQVELRPDDADPFALLEKQLREQEDQTAVAQRAAEEKRLQEERLAREAARLEADRLENARVEEERRAAAQLESDLQDALRREAAKLEAERAEAARLEAERLEAARLEAARLEAARLEAERLEAERREAARREAERLEAERREAERLEAERHEQAVLDELQGWLAAIEADRSQPSA